jgi:protein ImuB
MPLERRILSIFLPNFQKEVGATDSLTVRRHLVHLTQWAYRFSPIVAPDRLPKEVLEESRFYGFNIDITGCEKLYHGELELAQKISSSLSNFKLQHKIAIAPSLGGAWALSRYSSEIITIPNRNELREKIVILPIRSLRLTKKVEAQLQAVKIKTVQELLKIPRPSLLERFGKDILDRLDQLFGLQHEPLYPIKVTTLSKIEREIDGVVTELEAIKVSLWEMLEELLEKLKKLHVQPSQLVVQLKSSNKDVISKQIGLSVPSYTQKHLYKLLSEKLNKVQIKFGVEKIILIAARTEEYEPELTSFLAVRSTDSKGEKQLGELLDTLLTNLGEDRILTPSTNETRLPENRLVLRAIKKNKSEHKTDKEVTLFNSATQPRTERPSLLLNKPQPIRAMAALPDGPPFWVKWRGNTFEVTSAIGPERIVPEWWKGKNKGEVGPEIDPRDYFKVQIPTGAWLWVYRETSNSNWFLQGLWA